MSTLSFIILLFENIFRSAFLCHGNSLSNFRCPLIWNKMLGRRWQTVWISLQKGFTNMLGNSKMDVDQLNRCVKHYHFLSPHLQTSGFSNYTQRTGCNFAQPHTSQTHSPPDITTKWYSPFSRLFASRRASCEETSATEMIEQAQESLKQKGVGNTSIVSELEIQNYLAQETGKDRLFKMFTRE